MLRIKLVRSPIGHNWRNRRTIAALGLRKVHQVVEQPDNPSIRGMIHHIQSMVTVEVVEGEVSPKASKGVKGKDVKGKATAAPKAEPKAKKGAEKPIEEVPQPAEAEAKPKKAPAKKKVEENA